MAVQCLQQQSDFAELKYQLLTVLLLINKGVKSRSHGTSDELLLGLYGTTIAMLQCDK